MLMAIIGLLAPFLPDLLGLVRGYMDHKYEMEMMKLRIDAADREAAHRMEEIVVQAQAAENLAARKPHESYGVKLLQAADKPDSRINRFIFNLVFLAFSFLDWMISTVRPVITYWAFGLYAFVKWSAVYVTYLSSAKFSEGTIEALAKTGLNEATWTTFDQDMLMLIIGFWFGNRLRNGRSNGTSKS